MVYNSTFDRRFEAKVRRTPTCWLWTGKTAGRGYGQLSNGAGCYVYAHRYAWERAIGPIPVGLWVLHRCDVAGCVRPDHLFLGTAADNNRDAVAKGRHRGPFDALRAATACAHGHAFTPENTIVRARGRRRCRVCQQESERRYAVRAGKVQGRWRRRDHRRLDGAALLVAP